MSIDPNPRGAGRDKELRLPTPLYVVWADIEATPELKASPVVNIERPDDALADHSMDPGLIAALPALWYCLHLPKTQFEIIDMPLVGVQDALASTASHAILLLDTELLIAREALARIFASYAPTLMLASKISIGSISDLSREAGFALEPAAFDEIDQELLDSHWAALARRWGATFPPEIMMDPRAPVWENDPRLPGSAIAYKRARRLMGEPTAVSKDLDESSEGAKNVIYNRAVLNALRALEGRDVHEASAIRLLGGEIQQQFPLVRTNLVIGLAGTAPRYVKLVGAGAVRGGVADRSLADETALRFLVAHETGDEESMGFVSEEEVPAEAFRLLEQLERHWANGANPASEKRLRDRLDKAMLGFWKPGRLAMIRAAKRMTVFSNFPIGLLRPPGIRSPLAALVPITYRPINPMQRALQAQLAPDSVVDFSAGVKVLIVEAIGEGDPVGQLSRKAWEFTRSYLADRDRGMSVVMEEALTIDALNRALAKHRPDVLVLSAHGFHSPENNLAGVLIGNERTIGLDIRNVPPLVVLSACHTGPRGDGVVSIVDMLLAEGAVAVISTLVPVRVDHNSTFTMRLLLYMLQAAIGNEPEVSFSEVWHRVQVNTVVFDIAHGNAKFWLWCNSEVDGSTPLSEFMTREASGSIRVHALYEDAEAALLRIAERRGVRSKVAAWIKSTSYLPESMMYTLNGYPERIRLKAANPLRDRGGAE
ncbi:CHAT domain-containing protein [Cellulosimicrobium funkei]|uniref:CHAT domain-containing protein n=1 Tax=Cellulosimicrobium funkei TaxID=264251 RepID=UPI003652D066